MNRWTPTRRPESWLTVAEERRLTRHMQNRKRLPALYGTQELTGLLCRYCDQFNSTALCLCLHCRHYRQFSIHARPNDQLLSSPGDVLFGGQWGMSDACFLTPALTHRPSRFLFSFARHQSVRD